MIIEIAGRNPPGRSCIGYDNVHVGIGIGQQPFGLVAGDTKGPKWIIDVAVVKAGDGIDFSGKFVHGRKGDRFLYLNWGTVSADGVFELFRRAKLSLGEIEPGLVDVASREGRPLVCTVNLRDEKGNPCCARVRPPDIEWKVGPRKHTPAAVLDPATA